MTSVGIVIFNARSSHQNILVILGAQHRGSQEFVMNEFKIYEILEPSAQG
jgi:hypothetical protein